MNVGILGFGTIGSGVKEVIEYKNILKVVKVFDRIEKKDLIGEELFTSNGDEVVLNPVVDIVVETLGGDKLAHELIVKALKAGKHVVTSNKEVTALHFDEFIELAKENNVKFLFEASVGGGIPIIHSLIENTKFNDINHIYGILNATTNFILTRIEEGMSFEDAVKMAQSLGYAELDPTADFEGLDMVRKLAILADVAYDTCIDIDKVYHAGVGTITKEIMDFLRSTGNTIKFICESKVENNDIFITVEPVVVSLANDLANVKNEFNLVSFHANMNSKLEFTGKGAGKLPTASSVVSDLMKIKEEAYSFNPSLKKKYNVKPFEECKYFIVSDTELDPTIVDIKYGHYYFTKIISREMLKEINPKFYGRMFK